MRIQRLNSLLQAHIGRPQPLKGPRTSPQDDSVGTPPQSALKKVFKAHGRFVGIRLAFDDQNVGFLERMFSRVLDDYDSFAAGNRLRQDVQQRGFSVPVPPLIRMVLPSSICAAR